MTSASERRDIEELRKQAAKLGLIVSEMSDPQPWDDDPLENSDDAAKFLRVRPGTLAVWRSTGRYGDDLPHVKIGSRVFYRRSDLYRFREKRTRQQTKTAA